MATVNLANEGLSSGGNLESYLSEFKADNTTIEIPAGTFDCDMSAFSTDDYDNLEFVGTYNSSTGVVETEIIPDGRVTADWFGGAVRNIYIARENPGGTGGFYPDGGGFVADRLIWPNVEEDTVKSRFAYSGDMSGTRRTFQRCAWGGATNNGAYLDKNPSTYVRCAALNNNISQIRVGDRSESGQTSYVRNCVIGATMSPRTDGNNSPNARGLYVRRPGRTVVRDTYFVYTDSYGDAINTNDETGDHELVFEGNIHFHLEGGAGGLSASSGLTVDTSNATITVSGTSNPDFDGRIDDYTVIDAADAHVPTPAAITGVAQADRIAGLDLSSPVWDASAAPSGDPNAPYDITVQSADSSLVRYTFKIDGSVTALGGQWDLDTDDTTDTGDSITNQPDGLSTVTGVVGGGPGGDGFRVASGGEIRDITVSDYQTGSSLSDSALTIRKNGISTTASKLITEPEPQPPEGGCPGDMTWNQEQGTCVKPTCPEGTTWNADTKTCEAVDDGTDDTTDEPTQPAGLGDFIRNNSAAFGALALLALFGAALKGMKDR